MEKGRVEWAFFLCLMGMTYDLQFLELWDYSGARA